MTCLSSHSLIRLSPPPTPLAFVFSPQWVGSSCGLHGPYIFYKAFKFASRDAEARILSLGDFFLVRCKPDEPVCVAELQLLWEERTSGQLLSSSKLYFLPEDTPQGRGVSHGEVRGPMFIHQRRLLIVSQPPPPFPLFCFLLPFSIPIPGILSALISRLGGVRVAVFSLAIVLRVHLPS